MDAKTLLFVGLGVGARPLRRRAAFAAASSCRRRCSWPSASSPISSTRSASGRSRPRPPCTSCGDMVPVKLIPGTLNVGHTLPTIAQAFIYTQIVPVESTTLVLMIVAAVTGSWLGAGVVVHWPRRKIQIGMGLALLGAAALMLMTALQLFPAGGDTLGLTGVAARRRAGRQFRARRADDARHRSLRAVHDPGLPARHDPDGGVSDHDGLVRVPDADQQRPVREDADVSRAGGARPGDRRAAGGADRGPDRQVAAARARSAGWWSWSSSTRR